MTNHTSPRAIALDVLQAVWHDQAYSNLKLDEALRKNQLKPSDKGLITTLVYGVLQNKLMLDYQLDHFLRQKKNPNWLRLLLNTAFYQIHYLNRIPDRAVIYESVQIAKLRGNLALSKVVNGILRNFQRQGWQALPQGIPNAKFLSLTYSVPETLVQHLLKELDAKKVRSVLESINRPAKDSIRVNTSLISVDAALAQLQIEGYAVEKSLISPVGLIVTHGHVAESPLFTKGKIVLQDESAQLVAPAVGIQAADQVLDACAAPGGKTTQMATYLDPTKHGHITALDLYPHKVRLIQQNALRQHLNDRIETEVLDARKVGRKFNPQSFDKILVDAPCSGIGLMRRKPEIRYRKSTQDFKNLQHLQLSILNGVAEALKIDGQLVYSTCTIVQEENQNVIQQFLKQHPNFELENTQTDFHLKADQNAPSLTIFPDDFDSDGFFIATLHRKG